MGLRINVRHLAIALACGLVFLGGCVSPEDVQRDLDRFNAAGPVRIRLDESKLDLAEKPTGAYRVAIGDVLEFDMPQVMATVAQDIAQAPQRVGTHTARINSSGEIALPLLQYVPVAGKTLLEMEEYLTGLYHPKFLKDPPTVVANVKQYYTVPVTVLGGVTSPGTYELRRQELSLVFLLSKAGGIGSRGGGEDAPGARAIRIRRAATDTEDQEAELNEADAPQPDEQLIVLPVEGIDIDFVDVALRPGDVVEVERMDPRSISVIGLVNRAGVFPYSPRRSYSLLDAIALAGGLNQVADPKYATVYRMDQAGELVAFRFRISGWGKVRQGAATVLKPGDVVAVEHTAETSLRLLISDVVRVGFNVGDSFGFSGD